MLLKNSNKLRRENKVKIKKKFWINNLYFSQTMKQKGKSFFFLPNLYIYQTTLSLFFF